MKHRMFASSAAVICGLLVIPATQAAPVVEHASTVGQPAAWMPHDMIVGLSELPRRYSCDDLWYKFHDLLLTLGARPDMKILTYQCGPGTEGHSPQVQLRFSLPELLPPTQVRWMNLQAAPRDLRLTSGHPRSWKAGDCELMRQVKDALLIPITEQVLDFQLACGKPSASKQNYSITVRTVTPMNATTTVASAK